MSNGKTIAGRKKHIKFDLYETPTWATEKFIVRALHDGVLNTNDEIHECCSGAGAISKVLEKYGFIIKSSDIQNKDFIYGERGVDVYKLKDNHCKITMTNPPYILMTKFGMLSEFLRISENKVILLLNIYFLSSQKRKKLLEHSPLKYVYIHSDRLTMFPFGEKKPKNDGTKMFAWYVWEHGYRGEPVIRFL